MLLFYQILVLLALIIFLAIQLANLLELRPLPPGGPGGGKVSVLVPARNEERSIARCVQSLLMQDYPDFEVIVLDDASTDATLSILQALEAESCGRLRVLRGAVLPEGWHGKSWACRQLAEKASGEMLLFTDADTFHRPQALRRAVTALQEGRGDMLSITPRQELGSFFEHLVVPLVYVILMSYLPLRLVRTLRNPAFCFANGQFILFRREFYWKVNGHEAVRDALVEDVWLCMAVKKAGGRVLSFNGTDALSCRMYRNFREVWEGFSKNVFAGLGSSIPGLAAFVLFTAAFHLAPWGFLLYALFVGASGPALVLLPLLQLAVALSGRVLVARRFDQPTALTLLDPLARGLLLAIALNSLREARWGGGALWKGRRYRFS
ncbi:glycosyltransferase [Pelodictyon luteolum]|uniref:Glycosyl transferase n=1 Tax=Chlorobium luteolum (strain DSM 273 / BCRC 81028 / 2530) TaxID=319225 RepID=Q3B6A1_CHLL3|nr:glycosyltransferase [Pelodictyon luteolum]ABB23130.1 glycosyl transferase [Pelodictyon luteolum DSM 273]